MTQDEDRMSGLQGGERRKCLGGYSVHCHSPFHVDGLCGCSSDIRRSILHVILLEGNIGR